MAQPIDFNPKITTGPRITTGPKITTGPNVPSRVSPVGGPAKAGKAPATSKVQGSNFQKVLQGRVEGSTVLKFSSHATARLRARGIEISPELMNKLQDAVGKAAAKGSRDALLVTDKMALIVSVKNRTVITALDASSMKENVFTNIDSAVLI